MTNQKKKIKEKKRKETKSKKETKKKKENKNKKQKTFVLPLATFLTAIAKFLFLESRVYIKSYLH